MRCVFYSPDFSEATVSWLLSVDPEKHKIQVFSRNECTVTGI